MIKELFKKIKRLVIFNKLLQAKFIACIVLLVVVSLINAQHKQLNAQLIEAKANWDLVMEIPAMERKLRTKNLKLLKPESQIIAIRNILEGTSVKDGIYQAIIDGEVYSTGDTIGDYEIMNITMRTILLENRKVFDIKELSFPENSSVEAEP